MESALTMIELALDLSLAVMLVLMAVWLLTTNDHFKAVVLFILFGLLMALCWVRLQAPDIALAEAGIGAGLTGALFLAALRLSKPGSPLEDFHGRLIGHKPRPMVIVGACRKLLRLMVALVRDGKRFEPGRLAPGIAAAA